MKMKDYLAINPRVQRGSKYHNIKTEYNGTIFDSIKEANYAKLLDSCKRAVKPSERVVSYEMQVPYKITVNGKHIAKYIADFKVKYADGREVVIDVKGVRTGVYSLKKKLIEALYDFEIIEI